MLLGLALSASQAGADSHEEECQALRSVGERVNRPDLDTIFLWSASTEQCADKRTIRLNHRVQNDSPELGLIFRWDKANLWADALRPLAPGYPLNQFRLVRGLDPDLDTNAPIEFSHTYRYEANAAVFGEPAPEGVQSGNPETLGLEKDLTNASGRSTTGGGGSEGFALAEAAKLPLASKITTAVVTPKGVQEISVDFVSWASKEAVGVEISISPYDLDIAIGTIPDYLASLFPSSQQVYASLEPSKILRANGDFSVDRFANLLGSQQALNAPKALLDKSYLLIKGVEKGKVRFELPLPRSDSGEQQPLMDIHPISLVLFDRADGSVMGNGTVSIWLPVRDRP
ncbi:hypothetical protein [Mesorhizobium sp. M1378]|uniref:hypothetical protein n=1 Tax=Mesorhizobium sp. M1378 TaxID=2957092 RepID=UPI00333B8D47